MVDKKWKKLETIPAWDLEKVKSRKEGILEAQKDKKKVNFAARNGHLWNGRSSKSCRHGNLRRSREKKEVFLEAQRVSPQECGV